ncbi:MAG: hypothetical protein ACYC4F_06015 [Armatimonadota bacterium]
MESVRSVREGDLSKYLGAADLLVADLPLPEIPELRRFFAEGGSLLSLGCPPVGARTIDISMVKRFETLPWEPLLSGLIDDFRCETAWEIDTPGVRPLLLAVSGKPVAAPVVALDLPGGGRQVFASFATARKEIIHRLAAHAAMGASEFHLRPSFACFFPDERASLSVHAKRRDCGERALSLFITVRKDGITVARENVEIPEFVSPYHSAVPIQLPLSPGMYTVEARLSTGDPEFSDKFASYCTAGFWCLDSALVSMTQPISAGEFFMRGEKPTALLGAAYTAGLSDPNPARWEREFALMRESGMNTVRVSLPSRALMPEPGHPSEEAMRAATALALSAARHDLTLCVELSGETEECVAALSQRLSGFKHIIWEAGPYASEVRGKALRNGDFASVRTRADDPLVPLVSAGVCGKPILAVETDAPAGTDPALFLERKLAAAFACGGGAVEWFTSPTGFGMVRPDGTCTPALDLVREFSAFIKEANPYLVKPQPEEVCIFGGMERAVAVMQSCGVPVRAVRDASEIGEAKLVVLPCSGEIDERTRQMLASTTVLITGACGEALPVEPVERVIVFGTEYELRFVGPAFKAPGGQIRMEDGVICAPLPFELSDSDEAIRALYRLALRQAKVTPVFEPCEGVAIRPRFLKGAVLYTAISTSAEERFFTLGEMSVRLSAMRAAIFLVGRDGRLIAQYGYSVEETTAIAA